MDQETVIVDVRLETAVALNGDYFSETPAPVVVPPEAELLIWEVHRVLVLQ
jgi:hypothetical protein